jgi:hypothetical protein
MKFNVDHHFIYIIVCADEHKQQLQSYYKLKEEELEEIKKDWSSGPPHSSRPYRDIQYRQSRNYAGYTRN